MGVRRFLYPVLVLFAFIILLIYQNLNLQLSLPGDKWSRSIPMQLQSKEPIHTYKEGFDDNQTLYVSSDNGLYKFNIKNQFSRSKSKPLPIKIPYGKEFVPRNNSAYFIDEESLVQATTSGNQQIMGDINGLSGNGTDIFFWRGSQLFRLEEINKATKSIDHLPGDVKTLSFDQNSGNFLVIYEINPFKFGVRKYTLGEDKDYQTTELLPIEVYSMETLEEVSFISVNKQEYGFYEISSNAQGARKRGIFVLPMIEASGVENKERKALTFIEESTNYKLENPADMNLSVVDGQLNILFTDEGPTIGGEHSFNVYEAIQQKEGWKVGRRSTSNGVPQNPILIDRDTIVWTKFENREYELMGAFQNSEIVKESMVATNKDYSIAINQSLFSLFNGFFILISSILWLIGPASLIILTLFFNPNGLDGKRLKWLEPTIYALYLGMQMYYFSVMVNPVHFEIAPLYLNFNGGLVIVPILVAGCTWWITKLVASKDWEILNRFIYFVATNILFLMTLYGPYLF